MIILVFFTVPAFTYDGSIWGGIDGSFTRNNWIQEASSIDVARDVVVGYTGGYKIDKLFSIGEENADEEDFQMVEDVETYIENNFNVVNGDGFSYVVKRGDLDRGWDGWLIFSHYSSSEGWLHYLYYFSFT